LELLWERLAKFGLELHPEVTEQLIDETVDGTLEPIKGNRERSTAMR
jgi:hypothetical protein